MANSPIPFLTAVFVLGGCATPQARESPTALGETEARACAGVPAQARDAGPFTHSEDIVAVEALKETERQGTAKLPVERLAGAVVTLRASPGLTGEWLQRVIDCHLAFKATQDASVPQMANSPLAPAGVSAKVSSTGNGFAVSIRSEDNRTATEILERAERLAEASDGGARH